MQILPVSVLTRYLRDLLDCDYRLQSVWIEGEVSNFRRSPVGHCYFTLKDTTAQLRCAWFSSSIPSRAAIPCDGEQVIAHGRVSIYEQRGEYQLYVDVVQPAGVGALALQIEHLRARLEAEGLFDDSRKRPLPAFPRMVGVVTSAAGAAFQDIVHVLSRRFPDVQVVLAPTLVQGEAAVPQIVGALTVLNACVEPDVIILARGGGSLEDLSAFNDEAVARAIFGSRAPVVTGIGHETDYTIADLVSDVRAPTPSAAAELTVPDGRECGARLGELGQRLRSAVEDRLVQAREDTSALHARLTRSSPAPLIAEHRQAVDALAEHATNATRNRLALARARLGARDMQLRALNPSAVLARGYSIVRDPKDGAVVRSIRDVYPGAPLDVRVSDGSFGVHVDRSLWAQQSLIPEAIDGGAGKPDVRAGVRAPGVRRTGARGRRDAARSIDRAVRAGDESRPLL